MLMKRATDRRSAQDNVYEITAKLALGRLFSFAEAVSGSEEREGKACDLHKLEYIHSQSLLSYRIEG